MKHVNVAVSVIIAAAVLLAAYAIGLFIRQVRLQDHPPLSSVAVDPNTAAQREAIAPGRGAAKPRTPPTAEERAQAKAERARQLEQASTLTDEDKQQFRDQVRDKLIARGRPRRRGRGASPEEIEQIAQRWENLSEEERQAIIAQRQARMQEPSQAAQDATPDVSPQDNAVSDPNDKADTSEPNGTGSN